MDFKIESKSRAPVISTFQFWLRTGGIATCCTITLVRSRYMRATASLFFNLVYEKRHAKHGIFLVKFILILNLLHRRQQTMSILPLQYCFLFLVVLVS